MDLITEIYKLKLIDSEDATCNIKILPNIGKAHLPERRKLYVIIDGNEVLYVGEASTSIKTRFQRGCTSFNYYILNQKARGGYKGYKWLNKVNNPIRELIVLVVIFDKSKDNNREFIEAIEGELVYLIRNKFGFWPKFQNEIHFSNNEAAKKIAEVILEKTIINFNNEGTNRTT